MEQRVAEAIDVLGQGRGHVIAIETVTVIGKERNARDIAQGVGKENIVRGAVKVVREKHTPGTVTMMTEDATAKGTENGREKIIGGTEISEYLLLPISSLCSCCLIPR